jgi:archaellum component FlaF (FlaF/FlaG flagellin family)
MPTQYELHVQEGFSGESVEVLVEGRIVATFEARTRMQIGVAHVEKLLLDPGQTVTVRIKDRDVEGSITAVAGKRFIIVNMQGDLLTLKNSDALPGYL